MHTLAALLLTAFLAAGLAGLGDLLRGRSAGDRWVRGWTLLWWVVALAAQGAGPRPAIVLGIVVVGGGCLRAAVTLRQPAGPPIALAVAVSAGALLWMTTPFFYDTLVYHIGLPWTWLANGSFGTIAHNSFSHFPLAGQTVFLLPVGLGVPEAAAGLHWVTFLVTLVAVARVAENLGAGRWRWLAPVLLVACWHATWMAGLAAVDHLVVLGVVVSVQLLTEQRGDDGVDWAGVGLAWGLPLAAKYQAALPVAAVGVAALALCSRQRLRVLGAGALALALSSFWWMRNLVETHNPVFPLLWRVLGGSGWTLRDDQRYQALVREGVQGGSLQAALARLVVPPEGLGWWFLIALALALVALLRRGESAVRVRLVGLAVTLACAAWIVSAQTTRYALPIAALVAAMAATGAAGMGRWPARVAACGLGLTVAHGLLTLGVFLAGTLRLADLRAGRVSAEAWRAGVTVDDPMPAYRACDRLLPADARVLVVGEGRSWGCPRPHHVSSPYDMQLAQAAAEGASSPEGVADLMRGQGFTHLVISWSELERLGGPDYRVLRFEDPRAAERWRSFLRTCTSPLWREGALELRVLEKGCTPGLDGMSPIPSR